MYLEKCDQFTLHQKRLAAKVDPFASKNYSCHNWNLNHNSINLLNCNETVWYNFIFMSLHPLLLVMQIPYLVRIEFKCAIRVKRRILVYSFNDEVKQWIFWRNFLGKESDEQQLRSHLWFMTILHCPSLLYCTYAVNMNLQGFTVETSPLHRAEFYILHGHLSFNSIKLMIKCKLNSAAHCR